jgi:anthranilate phosphoribosyltransferase
MSDFDDAVRRVGYGDDLSEAETSGLIDAMLRGEAGHADVGRLLLALRRKGESVSELVGAARAMRRHMTAIPHRFPVVLDTCGTGGSGSGTFNISTAVAIVTASCGIPVAKHGNRRATSRTGSADVLEQLGVGIESEPGVVADRLREVGLCFCFARKLHPAMRHVAEVRRELGVPTLFNLLGPLCNPAGATHQLLGAVTADAQQKIASALAELGTTRSFVIRAEDGQDEVSLDGCTHVIDVGEGPPRHGNWTARDFGLAPAGAEALAAADPAESAAIIRRVLDGEPGACRDSVIAGTAAAMLLVGQASGLGEGARQAAEAIDSGAAAAKLESLRAA